MDTELLKTFLEVQKTRHFGKAADNLYLTQSAVSFRIRQLEQSLGVTLFNRFRNNIQLTTAGEMLLPHAQAVLSAIASAKQQLALNYHPDKPLQLCLSSELSVLFQDADFNQMISSAQQCQLQFIPAGFMARQSQVALDGMVILGSQLPEPQPWQALCLGYLELVAVATVHHEQQPEGSLGLLQLPRIMQSAMQFSCAEPAVLLQWLLANQACAYLPLWLVRDAVAQKQLQRLALPEVRIPVWAYSQLDASWPTLWRTTLQRSTMLLSAG
ncbi:LysR family transcriptional regulator [Rheinheimera riviphila]|uniref:LysR family transcriptional regulator n=1 Tax=Rheinheimera riviphila TaxID=1834037 RepID=UPI001F0C35C9